MEKMETPRASSLGVLSDSQKQILTEDSKSLEKVLKEIGKLIVGQENMVRSLLLGLLTEGHVLLEGLPGLAKTLAVKSLASVFDAHFQRIQFTPDLLPSDLIGTMIYRPETQEFIPKKGPIFAHLILADEINRAPAKVQSALLEAMAEKQITLGEKTYSLDSPFLVLATQNPIEQEGTYTLPEAQLDRFMFKVKVGYPSREQEKEIIERMGKNAPPSVTQVLKISDINRMKTQLDWIYSDPRIEDYILRLVLSTRKEIEMTPQEASSVGLKEIRQYIRIGASPRASLFLHRASKARAFLDGRNYVSPDDVKAVALEVLRHRMILTFDAETRGFNPDQLISKLLETVAVP